MNIRKACEWQILLAKSNGQRVVLFLIGLFREDIKIMINQGSMIPTVRERTGFGLQVRYLNRYCLKTTGNMDVVHQYIDGIFILRVLITQFHWLQNLFQRVCNRLIMHALNLNYRRKRKFNNIWYLRSLFVNIFLNLLFISYLIWD